MVLWGFSSSSAALICSVAWLLQHVGLEVSSRLFQYGNLVYCARCILVSDKMASFPYADNVKQTHSCELSWVNESITDSIVITLVCVSLHSFFSPSVILPFPFLAHKGRLETKDHGHFHSSRGWNSVLECRSMVWARLMVLFLQPPVTCHLSCVFLQPTSTPVISQC